MATENDEIIETKKDEEKIANPSSSIKWIEQMINIINKYGIIKILQAVIAIIIVSLLIYLVVNPNKMFQLYDDYREATHQELIDKRIENTPKIQDACDELLLRTNADRVIFMELHNNTGNISGMPFYYASASCESLADGIHPVAYQYMEVKLSLMPFATHLFDVNEWEGDMEDLKKYDQSLYYRMMSNEAYHSAFKVVDGIDRPCGIIIVSYKRNEEKARNHDPERMWSELDRTARKIAYYVEAPHLEK